MLYSNSESGTVGVHLIVHILFLQMSDQGSGDIKEESLAESDSDDLCWTYNVNTNTVDV